MEISFFNSYPTNFSLCRSPLKFNTDFQSNFSNKRKYLNKLIKRLNKIKSLKKKIIKTKKTKNFIFSNKSFYFKILNIYM